jgi:hypothetical protein
MGNRRHCLDGVRAESDAGITSPSGDAFGAGEPRHEPEIFGRGIDGYLGVGLIDQLIKVGLDGDHRAARVTDQIADRPVAQTRLVPVAHCMRDRLDEPSRGERECLRRSYPRIV